MSTNQVKPVALIILDGWGYREETKDNAIAAANTPNFDALWAKYPHALLQASGLAVGLPEGQMGNSEVGHTTIGAGRAVDTDLVQINKAVAEDKLAGNEAVCAVFDHVKEHASTLHLMGLLSDGGVHSHQSHLHALLKAAKAAGITRVAIHAFTDGRDTAPQSAGNYLKELEAVIAEAGVGSIVSVTGRFYAMDRDNNWDRLAAAEAAMFKCEGQICKLEPASQIVNNLYQTGALDEHLKPLVFLDEHGKGWPVGNGDGVFIFNFRPDRVRMLLKHLLNKQTELNLKVATMTEYDPTLTCPAAFPPVKIETTLAKEISAAHLTQAHIAETEKFPHATYFLNGGVEVPYAGEEHIMLPSHKDVPTHDLAPEMQATGIADKTVEQVKAGKDFIFVNIANADMVGHTANVPAIITAVEAADAALGKMVQAIEEAGGIAIITADHGNAEINKDELTGEKHTAHTTNPVPVIITSHNFTIHEGTLADLAPTILKLLNLPVPASMTGRSLLHPLLNFI